jgi:hypothetical protein
MSGPVRIQTSLHPAQDAPMPDLDAAPLAQRFAQAVLLFFRGGIWTREDHDRWAALTGERLCTTRALGDMARRLIEEGKDAGETR